MTDENLARLRAHRQNIDRYRRLLETNLNDVERRFVEQRISEEKADLDRVASGTFSTISTFPDTPAPRAA
jgi:hypothetical protein